MASESDDPDGAAERLEAALERIAAAATSRSAALPEPQPATDAVPFDPVVLTRLDSLIERLRGALADRTG